MNDVVDEEDATGVMAIEISSSKITDHIAALQWNMRISQPCNGTCAKIVCCHFVFVAFDCRQGSL